MTRQVKPCTQPSECRSCGAKVLWVEFQSGKRAPVDAIPAKDGTFVLTHRPAENKLLAEKFHREWHAINRRRFNSHFSTCPNAAQHRRST